MTNKKAFIYTVLTFALMTLISYIADAQPKKISMQEAVSLTITNNREIKIARLDIDRSKQQVRVAKSLSLPTVTTNAQVAHYFLEPVFFGFGNGSNTDKISYGRFGGRDQALALLSLSQPLYNPAAKPSLISSKLSERESGFTLTDKEKNIAALVKQTYLQILVLNERIRLQQESLNRNQKALDDAKSLLAQGRALRVDTLRAYTSVKNLEPDLLRLSYAVQVGKLQLKTLIGIDSLQEIELSDSLALQTVSSIPSEEEVYQDARANRSDLKALDLQQQVSDQQIRLAAAATKPNVSLIGQYQVATQTSQFNYFNAYYPSTPLVGAQITIPIFNGNSNQAKISQAKIEKQQSVIRLANAYEQLRVEVRQVVANLQETAARLQTRSNVKETAQLSYEITQYRYARGVASRLELTDAELALTAAQSNYLEAVYDYLYAGIALEKTIGK
ncbi:MAG: TolC family protein [Bacteroidetes bacterium]|nr:TolC family protein [Bacteroidota bacterium]